jgi:hypothetical protein
VSRADESLPISLISFTWYLLCARLSDKCWRDKDEYQGRGQFKREGTTPFINRGMYIIKGGRTPTKGEAERSIMILS